MKLGDWWRCSGGTLSDGGAGDVEDVIVKGTVGALEYVFGGLFVVLFVYTLWEKRQTEKRLTEQNERLVTALQNTINNLGSLETALRRAIRDELNAVLSWTKAYWDKS